MVMPPMSLEIFGDVNFYLGMGIKVVTAIFLGGLIGLDRERKMKAAGIKTNILICLGSTLYVSISILNSMVAGNADPNRIAAQVVSGIGFLGAGSIIHGKGQVVGLTTAATIWIVAAIGVAIGSGYPFVATIFTVTILVVLKLLGPLFHLIELKRPYHVEVLSSGSVKKSVRQIILARTEEMGDIVEETTGHGDETILHIYAVFGSKNISDITNEIEELVRVKKANIHSCHKIIHEVKEAA
jgi:putative Mg2+ transporter-C (MgtC) family protein